MDEKKLLSSISQMMDEKLDKRLSSHTEQMSKMMDEKLGAMEKRTDAKLEALEQRMNKRFEQVDKRFEQVDKKLEDMQQQIEENRVQIMHQGAVIEGKIEREIHIIAENQTKVFAFKQKVNSMEEKQNDLIDLVSVHDHVIKGHSEKIKLLAQKN